MLNILKAIGITIVVLAIIILSPILLFLVGGGIIFFVAYMYFKETQAEEARKKETFEAGVKAKMKEL